MALAITTTLTAVMAIPVAKAFATSATMTLFQLRRFDELTTTFALVDERVIPKQRLRLSSAASLAVNAFEPIG